MKSHGWQFVFLMVCVVGLTGCGNNKDKKDGGGPARWDAFPVAIYTDPSIVNDTQSKSDFQEAMNFWEAKVGKKLFDYQGSMSGQPYNGTDSVSQNAVYVPSSWTYATNIAAQTIVLSQSSQIKGAVIMVNSNTNFCGGDCTGMSGSTSMRKVFAHELGHFLGLGHSQDTSNVMYPDALPGGSLAALTINVEELRPLVQ